MRHVVLIIFAAMLLSLAPFCCSSTAEYRISNIWQFMSANETGTVVSYYHFDETQHRLDLRLENRTSRPVNGSIGLRIYKSRLRDVFVDEPVMQFNLPLAATEHGFQILTFELHERLQLSSVEAYVFSTSESPD